MGRRRRRSSLDREAGVRTVQAKGTAADTKERRCERVVFRVKLSSLIPVLGGVSTGE